jgi:N4-(beta-N-acetylglucosaminyl)-L-asparaginase
MINQGGRKGIMDISRRQFIARAGLAAAGSTVLGEMAYGAERGGKPLLVSTYAFGERANEAGLEVIRKGGTALDAVEQGARVIEADPTNTTVGIGGIPNAEGMVQLDAAIMWGPGSQAGSVTALEGFLHPISVARRVLKESQHVMLVGDGARYFAVEQGFKEVELLTEKRRQAWLKWKAKHAPQAPRAGPKSHDTLALLARDADGNIAAACTTSGIAYKLPGRVGDSPIIGSGLYVDNEVGAAGATGTGEHILQYCGSFLVVEYMRLGKSPLDACREAIEHMARKHPQGKKSTPVSWRWTNRAATARPALPGVSSIP